MFLTFISKTVNNQCYNPYISGKIFSRFLWKCMGCRALIVYRFRDKRQKHQHRRLNSYRGDYIQSYKSDRGYRTRLREREKGVVLCLNVVKFLIFLNFVGLKMDGYYSHRAFAWLDKQK